MLGTKRHKIELSNVQGNKQTEASGKTVGSTYLFMPSEWLTVGQLFVSLTLAASLFLKQPIGRKFIRSIALTSLCFMSPVLRY